MKRFLALFIVFLLFTQHISAQDFKQSFEKLPSVKQVERIDSDKFLEKYLIWFEQPIDHKDPSVGTFLQRVFVCCTSIDSSTVFVTEGYGAAYAEKPSYRDEISALFNLNNVVAEHRYFLKSKPENVEWEYLTAENAANDYHRIITELKTIFDKKWIATGISKGGQNSAIFTAFFPKDIDFTVPYVGPFCRKLEDGRHEPFIADFAGSRADRRAVQDFQIEFLKRRHTILPMLDSLIKEKGYEYRIPLDEIYDMTALEFSFAFWQWGTDPSLIPGNDASDKEIFNFMVKNGGPDYWVKESDSTPFYVMAAHELGYYGYDIRPFKDYLTIKSTKGYLKRIFLPEDAKNIKFDKTLSRKMKKFFQTTDSRMLFIYGEFDPWSSVRAFEPFPENIHLYIDPAGSHRARINTFSDSTQEEIKSILAGWLYE